MVLFCIGFGIVYQVQICKSDKKREKRNKGFTIWYEDRYIIPNIIIKSE